jgi:hypothetical protein
MVLSLVWWIFPSRLEKTWTCALCIPPWYLSEYR